MGNLIQSVKELISPSRTEAEPNRGLTEAEHLWMQLPENVKCIPALATLRQFYEKEHGKSLRRSSQSNRPEDQPDHQTTPTPKPSLGSQIVQYTKIALLLACWMFFTSVFLMYNEKEVVVLNSAVVAGDIKSYEIQTQDLDSLLLKISGPFQSVISEVRLNSTEIESAAKMDIWVERLKEEQVVQKSKTWSIILEEPLDFNKGEPRQSRLKLEPFLEDSQTTFKLRLKADADQIVPFAMSYTVNPIDVATGVINACLLLCWLYVLLAYEVLNRTLAAVLVSTTALAVLSMIGERPSLKELISWLEMDTLLLLFSMMLLVAIMAETGLFDFLAVYTFEVTKGKLWPLIRLLCAMTAILSSFLDNVTTVLLMTPVTIRLCECMNLNPIPVLISMVLFSNIGGTATPVGDPPNVIIASNQAVVQAGINFANFTLHMTLGIILVCIQTWIQLRYFIYRDTNKLRLDESLEILGTSWYFSASGTQAPPGSVVNTFAVPSDTTNHSTQPIAPSSPDLPAQSIRRACSRAKFQSTLQEMKEKYNVWDKALLIKSAIAIGFVVTVFFLHSIPELKRVSLGWTALLGAILLLILADREDLQPILNRVEWSTLLFFAALFVLMEALTKLGLIEFMCRLTELLITQVDESARLAVSIILMLWVSGVTSAFVDNIPLTTMMVRVVTSLGSNPTLNLPMAPLIWALSFGACLGGNGTLIGASANVVCAGVAEQHGYKLTFMQFFKVGFPVMIGHLIVASGYLMFCHVLFKWH